MSGEIARAADRLTKVPREIVPKAAGKVEDIAEAEARAATGDGRMSGMGRRGPKLRAVTQRITSTGTTTTALVIGVPAGAWAILETGATAHVIGAHRRDGVLAGSSMIHPVRGRIRHPGSRGKRTWSKVVDRAAHDVPEMMADAVAEAVR